MSIVSDQQDVLIAIPTYQRSARLKNLIPHVVDTIQSVHRVEILVVDNNPLPVEQNFIQDYAKTSSYPLHYVHEPKPGVSNARNAALKFANSRFLAFLDDDMEVTKAWIDSLVRVSLEYEAGLVFGPLIAKFADAADPRNPYLSSGCLIDLETCIIPETPFDTKLNESGGEDDIFFEALHKSGTRYGWAPEALCYECVPPARTTSSYIRRRNFGYGQGPSRIAAAKGWRGLPQIIRHMSVGLAQLIVFGFAHILAKFMKRPSQVRYLALSARGLGKIFWFDKFRPKLYGAAAPNT